MGTKPHWQDDIPAELITPVGADQGSAAPGEVLTGLLDGPIPRTGPGAAAPVWRLYQSHALDRYLEVDQTAILGAVRLPEGETLLRVEPDALVRSVVVYRAGRGPMAFLNGPIASSHHHPGGDFGGQDDPPHTPNHPCKAPSL